MIFETIAGFLNVFSPKKSPYYSVFLICAICMCATGDVSIVLAPYVILVIVPIFIVNYLLCLIRPSEITELNTTKHLFEHKIIGVASGAISLMLIMNSDSYISMDGKLFSFSKEFIEIYTGIALIVYYFYFIGNKNNIVTRSGTEKESNELPLLSAILLISMAFIGKDISADNAEAIYYDFFKFFFWFNMVVHFMYYHTNIYKRLFLASKKVRSKF